MWLCYWSNIFLVPLLIIILLILIAIIMFINKLKWIYNR